MITNKPIIGKDTVLYLNSSIILDANNYDTVIFSGNSSTLTLPRTIDSINGQKLKIQNTSNSCLTVIVQGIDIINDANPVLQLFLYNNETVTLMVDVNNIEWIVTDKTEIPLVSLPTNYAVKAVSTWTDRNLDLSALNSLESVCWSSELKLFVAVSQSAGVNAIQTSNNGINWTTQAVPAGNTDLREVVWATKLGLFITVRSAVVNNSQILTSSNGVTWTEQTTPAPGGTYVGLIWANDVAALGTGLAVAIDSNTSNSVSVMTSADAITWNIVATFADRAWRNGCWSPELQLFVVVGNNGASSASVMTSPDGSNWTIQTTPALDLENVCWAAKLGLFIAISTNGFVVTSPNGINWTLVFTTATANPQNIAWSPELGVAVVSCLNDKLLYSFNGTSWTEISPGFAAGEYAGICWAPDLGIFCIVNRSASVPFIYTSSFKARPPTSYNTMGVNLNNVSKASIWNYNMFGRGVPVTISAATATITEGQNWIIVNFAGTCTLTLPTAATANAGMELTIKTVQAQLVNSSVNITQFNGTSSTAILAAVAGRWATLVSNGTSWVIMHSN